MGKRNRHHGAAYEHGDFSSLEDESISIYANGIIPLFYKTLVDEKIPIKNGGNKLVLQMKQVYPYIRQVSAEYQVACKPITMKLIPFKIILENTKPDFVRLSAHFLGDSYSPKLDFPKMASSPPAFVRMGQSQQTFSCPEYKKDDQSIWDHLRRNLLYDDEYLANMKFTSVLVGVSGEDILFPGEFPIICAFYHLSNIVRYNPRAMNKIMDSQYWPVTLALQSHGLFTFLLLFYRYVMKTTTFFYQA